MTRSTPNGEPSAGTGETARPETSVPSLLRGRLRTKLLFLMVATTAATLLVGVLTFWMSHGMSQRLRLEERNKRIGDAVQRLGNHVVSGLENTNLTPATVALAYHRLVADLRGYLTNMSDQVPFTAPEFLEADRSGWLALTNARTGLLKAGAPAPDTIAEPWINRLTFTATNWVAGNTLHIVAPLRNAGPATFGAVSVELALAREKSEGFNLLGAAGIVLMISLLTSWLISSQLEPLITRPITQIAQTMLHVTEVKDYSPRLRHEGNDEIGDLVRGFNTMLATVEQRDAALHEAQQKLEQRVEERTRALRQQISERSRAEKDLSQQLARIRLLNQITRAISDRQDLESILSVLLSELTLRLPADFGCALLLDPQSAVLRVACCRELQLDTSYLAWKVDDWSVPLAGSGWESPADGPVFIAGNLTEAPRKVFAKAARLGMEAGGALPLRYDKKLLGVLVVARRNHQPFTEEEQAFLIALADHVALAGHQARLYAELHQAYNELRQTQHTVMQHERLRALGQMASGIAHDINNALSPVSGFAELVLSTETQLTPNGRKYLTHIKTASDDVAHIVSRLREFYRSRADQQPRLPVRVAALVEGVVELTRPRWRDISQQRGIDVQVLADVSPDPLMIEGVEPELREALTNLLFNALDAMPQGGTIALRTRKANRTPNAPADAPPTHVIIEVIDSGTGMDEDTRKRCLEPFFSTKGQRGTGLGLAMVFGTVQRHEGTLEIESAPGRGTIMRLIFPAATATEITPKPAPCLDQLPKLRVLFVDDEPLLRELIRELLETDHHTVITADGGMAGLATFQRLLQEGNKPDVVITDLGMPQLDGRALTVQIKSASPDTPVIMMTGWGKMMRGESDVRAPVDALVSKPPQMAELNDALRRVILKSRGSLAAAGQ